MTESEIPTWKRVGATLDVNLAWTLPDGGRLWVVINVEVIEVVEEMMRLECQIKDLPVVRATLSLEEIDPAIVDGLRNLPGKYVRVPYEATTERHLHLKISTLTGEHSFFSPVYPRPKKPKAPLPPGFKKSEE